MGKIDIQTNEYMSDIYRFADLFNFFLYEGKQVIKPESLHELSETALALPYGDESGSTNPIQKYRDVFKMAAMEDGRAAYLLLGLEDQSEVHYAISVKNMLYDAAQYAKQVEDAARTHRNEAKVAARLGEVSDKKKVSSAEFLSGFHKDDRLLPVVTLVLHWSPDEWDGARSIHEMFAVEDETLLRFVPDYRINLLSPKDIADHDFGKFQTTLAEALQYVKYSKEKDSLERIINENPKFKHLDRRTAEV